MIKDYFEEESAHFEMPCRICKHRHGNYMEAPCKHCSHNLAAVPEDETSERERERERKP